MAVGVSHDSAEGLISKIVKKVKGYFVRTGLSKMRKSGPTRIPAG
jgi:hypothetical protein